VIVHGAMHDAALACDQLTRGVNRRSAYLSEVIMSRPTTGSRSRSAGWPRIEYCGSSDANFSGPPRPLCRARRDGVRVHEGVRQEAGRGEGDDVQLPERRDRRAPKSGRIWKSEEEHMKKSGSTEGQSASELIDKRIAELGDWRGETLSRMRKLIKEADPDVVEEWKWMGTPVWSHDGIICTGESYKSIVKLTFAKGASLKDPAKLFNSSLDGNARRAIDIHEGEEVDAGAFKALIRAAVALNTSGGKARPRRAK
jgi:hypothetical protein